MKWILITFEGQQSGPFSEVHFMLNIPMLFRPFLIFRSGVSEEAVDLDYHVGVLGFIVILFFGLQRGNDACR